MKKETALLIAIICAMVTSLILGIAVIKLGAKDIPYNHSADCFSVEQCNNRHHMDSVAYLDAESMIDSLVYRTTELETQLAGCEFQDHSRLVANQ
jgi:hypothetical protein